jgi:cholesterol oxidase
VGRRFDVIVVGSGFGGAVTACRLAEAGARVLVLERGRRWTKPEYPRRPGDAWLFDHDRPEKHHGWLDLRFFKGMAVAQGAGVGGGSLCYSSVVMEADADRFAEGWPPEIGRAELDPHYDKVRTMLGVRPIPASQHTRRYKLMEEAARKSGLAGRFSSVPLALSFDPEWSYDLPDAISQRYSKPFTNAQGRPQGTCVHLGNCDLGCEVHAKNTLDLNYIPAAEDRGAEVRPLHLVRSVRPEGGGYAVAYERIDGGRLVPGEEAAGRVVLAAGSLGTTELLLRCRDEHRTLPGISARLGEGWSPNANVLTPDRYPSARDVQQSIGPTISGGLDFMDGSAGGHRFYVEDDGFPNLMLNAVDATLRAGRFSLLAYALRAHLRRGTGESNPLGNVMMWLGEGVDAADGKLYLGRRWLPPWKTDLKLSWDVARSRPVIDAILDLHQRLSRANGGSLQVPLYWTLLHSLVTVHPLGGCRMGRDAGEAVVDHRGEVFGHPNLFVADGSVLPRPVGRNPSMTIAALAERSAQFMAKSGG